MQPAGRPGAPAACAAPPLEGRPERARGPGALRADGARLVAPDPAGLTYSLQPWPLPAWLPYSLPTPVPPPAPRPCLPRGPRCCPLCASFWPRVTPHMPLIIGGQDGGAVFSVHLFPHPEFLGTLRYGIVPYALHQVSLIDHPLPSKLSSQEERGEVSRNPGGWPGGGSDPALGQRSLLPWDETNSEEEFL